MAVIYTAHATATGGRDGHTETDDKKVSFDLSGPGSSGAGTNPEQLFAAGYAACFGGAAQFIAKKHGLEMGAIEVRSAIDLHKDDNGFFLAATIDVQLPGLERAQAVALVEETHQFCPYSKATRGNIVVTLKVNGETI